MALETANICPNIQWLLKAIHCWSTGQSWWFCVKAPNLWSQNTTVLLVTEVAAFDVLVVDEGFYNKFTMHVISADYKRYSRAL